MGCRDGRPPPPSPRARLPPQPLPRRLQGQPPQLPVFSPQINRRGSAWRGVDKRCPEQVGEGQTLAEVAGGCPAGVYRGCAPGAGVARPAGDEGAEPAAAARRAAA